VNVCQGEEQRLYDAGWVLYFHNLNLPSATPWLACLDDDLGLVRGLARLSAFASRRGRGLPAHYDTNDNFICQLIGTRLWKAARNHHARHPTVGYTIGTEPRPTHWAEAPMGFPNAMPSDAEELVLRPGSVLFMPRGMWHSTESIDDSSLHINIQISRPSWRDVIEFLLASSATLNGADAREPIRHMFTDGGLRVDTALQLTSRLRSTFEELLDGEVRVDPTLFGRYLRSRNRLRP
jgi:ribosomal protein L16 Arg81 hydroxylase